MDIFDKNLKDGILFVGERGLLNITRNFKKESNERVLDNLFFSNITAKFPFCNNVFTSKSFLSNDLNYLVYDPGYFSAKLWFYVKIPNYKKSIKSYLPNLDESIMEIGEFKDISTYDKKYDYFFVAYDRDDLKDFFVIERISKKIKEKLSEITKEIVLKAIYYYEGLIYSSKYYAFYKDETKKLFFPKEDYFFGPTMKENGLEEYIKTTLREKYLKPILINTTDYSSSNMERIWNSCSITPRILKREIPEIIINDYGEFYELILNDETELFSKENFEMELVFHDKGEMGEKIQNLIRKRLKKFK